MLSNPVNLPCGTKCWREFNIFWSGYFAFVLFIIIIIIIVIIIIIIIAETDLCSCKRLIFLAGDLFLGLSGSRVQL